MTVEKIRPQLSEFELECQLRKELGLSAWGMVENTWLPWRIRVMLEYLAKQRREGANTSESPRA